MENHVEDDMQGQRSQQDETDVVKISLKNTLELFISPSQLLQETPYTASTSSMVWIMAPFRHYRGPYYTILTKKTQPAIWIHSLKRE